MQSRAVCNLSEMNEVILSDDQPRAATHTLRHEIGSTISITDHHD